MKIAMFSDCYLDLTGGIATLMDAQKKALEDRGHIVYIFSTGFPRKTKEIKKLARKNVFLVPSCRIFFRGLSPVSRRPKIVEKWLLKEHPELRDFDIFYTHYESGCSIAGIRLANRLKIPVVQIMHGREDMGETNIIPFGLRTVVATALNIFHSWYLPHTIKVKVDNYLADSIAKAKMWTMMANHANAANKVVVPSRQFQEKLKHYGVKKEILVVPNGVSDDYFPEMPEEKTSDESGALRIIWHSRVSAEKRMMPFLKALEKAKGNWQLDVFGGGGDAFRARKFARRHKLNVKFHGNTTFKALQKQLLKSDLDILVSYNFDTFGMTLIEAQAAGVPVFICDPDLAETVPEKGRMLAKGPSPEQMAEALNELINHPEKIKAMSKEMMKKRKNVLMSKRILELEKIFIDLKNKGV